MVTNSSDYEKALRQIKEDLLVEAKAKGFVGLSILSYINIHITSRMDAFLGERYDF